MYMNAQKLFNPLLITKIIQHAHLTLQKTIDYAQKIEREFFPVEGIQQKEFNMVMSRCSCWKWSHEAAKISK